MVVHERPSHLGHNEMSLQVKAPFCFREFLLRGMLHYKILRVPSFLCLAQILSFVYVLILNATQLLSIYHEASTLIGAGDTRLNKMAQW